MKKISSYTGQSLLVVQPSIFKREYKLKSSDEVLATLDYPKFFSNDAVTEILGEKYEIKQPSIWHSEVDIYKTGQSYSFAKYESNFWQSKGELNLPRGEKLNFKFGFIKCCEISMASGELLLVFKNSFSFKVKNFIEIQKHSEILDDNPWVILLGWYLVLQHHRRAAAG